MKYFKKYTLICILGKRNGKKKKENNVMRNKWICIWST